MRALLICPEERPGVAALAESAPVSTLPILGKSLVEHWLEHLTTLGATEVRVLVADHPDQVRSMVGDGARWGLRAIVQPEKRELSVEEARARYQQEDPTRWLPAPNDAVCMDHLPGMPNLQLTLNYADWFAAAQELMPRALTPQRIGVHEIKPGVIVGLHAHIAQGAKLIPPCWIGERAWVAPEASIGPNTVLEEEAMIARGAEVSRSIIGPRTFVGQFTEIRNSIAWGSTLINWERDSCVRVSDPYLLCSLEPRRSVPVPAKAAAGFRLREFIRQAVTRAAAELVPPR